MLNNADKKLLFFINYHKSTLLLSYLHRGQAEVFLHVLAKVRWVGESETVAYLLQTQVGLFQIVADVL